MMLFGQILALIPPFSGLGSLLQVFVPVLSAGRRLNGHGIAFCLVFGPQALRRGLAGAVRVQS